MNIFYQLLGYFNVPSLNNIKAISNIDNNKKNNLLDKRKKVIGSKCQIFYEDDPFVVSKASMQYLYDENGTRFIDCISNVQHGNFVS